MKKNKAFSIVELSVIVIVLGIIIAGAIKGNNLYKKSKLRIAQRLTTDSPVNVIPDLEVWFETTLAKSFSGTIRREGSTIGTWNDIKPSRFGDPYNAVVQSGTPSFVVDAIGSLPGVRFNKEMMRFSDEYTPMSDFTIFIVEKRIASTGQSLQTFLGGTFANNDATRLLLSYSGFNLDIRNWNNNASSFSAPSVYNEPRIHSVSFDQTKGREYKVNNGLTASHNDTVKSPIYKDNQTTYHFLGGYTGGQYDGIISEFIYYSRALNKKEKSRILDYLSAKYKIPIS